MTKPRLIHLTTTAVSLNWLLRPQLEAFGDAGYDFKYVWLDASEQADF